MVTVAVLTERGAGERRVALVPRSVGVLTSAGVHVIVESGAGRAAGHPDAEYSDGGAAVATAREEAAGRASLLLCAAPPEPEVADLLPTGAAMAGVLHAGRHRDLLERLAARGVDGFSLELLPRTTRAQEMDVLSSMSTLTGYHAAVLAAVRLPRIMPLLMTAAGTIRPARVLVIGAGVAGLQAIATARRLGAVVEAFDVRAAAREQVESLGARFVETGIEIAEVGTGYAEALGAAAGERQREVLAAHTATADAVITTALVAGGTAPRLITREMVAGMRPGSVIIDLAAEGGGNCELTQPGQEISAGGVTVCGPLDLPSRVAADASQLLSHNLTRFALHLIRDSILVVDLADEITAATCVVRAGALHGRFAAPDNAPALRSG